MDNKDKKMYDVLIIGGGPAGLTAAIYAVRANLVTGFIEKDAPGGKIVKTAFVENYPGFSKTEGPSLAIAMFNQTTSLGAEYIYGDVSTISVDGKYKIVKTKDGKERYAKAVIIATGTENRKIGCPGEKEYEGKGVSYCAICDGAFFKGQEIVVVGGGNSAIEETLYLAQITKKIQLIHWMKEFQADPIVVDKVKKLTNVEIHYETKVAEIIGNGKSVTEVLLEDINTKAKSSVKVTGVFPFIGLIPVTPDVAKLGIADPNHHFVLADDNMHTKVEGIFSAGDVNNKKIRQISTAISDGSIAALEAKDYINRIDWN